MILGFRNRVISVFTVLFFSPFFGENAIAQSSTSISFENEICSIKKICDSTELSNDIVNQIVIWLLKYSFISIGRK